MTDKRFKDCPVRVAVRIKPIESDEDDEKCVKQSEQDSNVLIVSDERAFTFDVVLGEKSSQNEVYDELVKHQTEKLINGFNCASLGIFFF